MAIAIFVVRATITADQEDAFNDWYNNEHAPQLLQYRARLECAVTSASWVMRSGNT